LTAIYPRFSTILKSRLPADLTLAFHVPGKAVGANDLSQVHFEEVKDTTILGRYLTISQQGRPLSGSIVGIFALPNTTR
jgi:hypothetical protein